MPSERSSGETPRESVSRASGGRITAARVLMWLASASAVVAAIGAVPAVLAADSGQLMAETWRMYGFLVFAALFALLAYRPLGYRWLWEIVIVNKLLLAVTAAGFVTGVVGPGDVVGAVEAAVADGVLVVLLVVSYVLCRGWRARAGQ